MDFEQRATSGNQAQRENEPCPKSRLSAPVYLVLCLGACVALDAEKCSLSSRLAVHRGYLRFKTMNRSRKCGGVWSADLRLLQKLDGLCLWCPHRSSSELYLSRHNDQRVTGPADSVFNLQASK
jgi:hypothetical protein